MRQRTGSSNFDDYGDPKKFMDMVQDFVKDIDDEEEIKETAEEESKSTIGSAIWFPHKRESDANTPPRSKSNSLPQGFQANGKQRISQD